MKKNFKFILVSGMSLFMCFALPLLAQAQGGLPCVGPDPLTGECPIDGGVVFLLMMGAAYGIKKIWNSKKAKIKAE